MERLWPMTMRSMIVTLACLVMVCGCNPRELLPQDTGTPPGSTTQPSDPDTPGDGTTQPEQPGVPQNIAPQVLPGKWQVVGESVMFTFDEQGNPVSVHNDADPTDFKTNIVFGEPQKLDTPIGMVDALFVPTVPEIDSQTGQARFGATSAISHIVLGGLPMPGAGHANYQFTGQYDAATGQLVGQSDIKVTYGFLVLYSDTLDNYVLQKIE